MAKHSRHPKPVTVIPVQPKKKKRVSEVARMQEVVKDEDAVEQYLFDPSKSGAYEPARDAAARGAYQARLRASQDANTAAAVAVAAAAAATRAAAEAVPAAAAVAAAATAVAAAAVAAAAVAPKPEPLKQKLK